MKKEILKYKQGLVLLLSVILFTACSKDEDNVTNAQSISETEVISVLETDQLAGIADTILTDISLDSQAGKGTSCYNGVETNNGFTVTFDDCEGPEGTLLNGTISVVYTGTEEDMRFTATYTNFFVGAIGISGTRSFDMNIDLTTGEYGFDVTSNLNITLVDGSEVTIVGAKTFTFTLDTNLTPTGSFGITGSWAITTDDGTYTVVVTEALMGSHSCTYFTEGSAIIAKNGISVGIDFGDGDCDDVATLTLPNGKTEQITLHD